MSKAEMEGEVKQGRDFGGYVNRDASNRAKGPFGSTENSENICFVVIVAVKAGTVNCL